jgi:hypothetical protein
VVLAVTKQIALVNKRFPFQTQRGTIEKVAMRCLVQPHPLHQVRFSNPARRSDGPTGITETKRKLLEINNLKLNINTKITRIKNSEQIFTTQISTSAKKQIAL